LITASIKVLNEAEYIESTLANIYPYVDKIDIVEGAVQQAKHAASSDGYSTDDTVKIIEEFPDPQRKIRLFRGHWRSKEDVQAKLLEVCVGKWIMFIDGDEAYLDSDLEQVREFCSVHLDGRIVYAVPERTLNFWHDFNHIAYSLNDKSPWGRKASAHPFLIWRDLAGLNFKAFHTYPCDGMGRNIILDDVYVDRRAVLNNLILYHYGHVKKPSNIANKLQYFKNRGTGEVSGAVEEDPWFSGKMPPDMVIADYNGVHPKALDNHPYRNSSRIKVVETKPIYRFEVVAA
jgi:glycosyltransferase involved in cell wall biosynthesis